MAMAKRPLAFPAPAAGDDEDLLDTPEAARRLGFKPETLKKMAQRREIPSVKYRKVRRFEPSVIREYIAKHRVG